MKGFLGDHITFKESRKKYYLVPGKELVDGLLFLSDDVGCMKMSDYTTDGGVAEVYVEYLGEQDDGSASEDNISNFEDEMGNAADEDSDGAPEGGRNKGSRMEIGRRRRG